MNHRTLKRRPTERQIQDRIEWKHLARVSTLTRTRPFDSWANWKLRQMASDRRLPQPARDMAQGLLNWAQRQYFVPFSSSTEDYLKR